MITLLRYLPVLSVVALSVACGDKGDEPAPDTTSAGGSGGSGGSGTETSNNGGSGGSSTSAGEGGGAGDPGEAMLVYGFDEGLEGWIAQYTSSKVAEDLIDVDDVEISWNEADGNPGGALQADIPYSAASQYVGYGVSLSAGIDLSGLVISADVMIQEGVGDAEEIVSAPPGAKLYAKSGDAYVYAAGQYTNIDTIGEWTTIYFDVTSPDYVDEENGVFDPSDIREIGIQFDTNGQTTSAMPGTWLADNISY